MDTLEKYFNPCTDFGFRKLFGKEVNKDLLIDFLNQIITKHGKITDLLFLSAEQLGRSPYESDAIFGVYCETKKGEKFIVEMQKSEHSYFNYPTFPIQEQAMWSEKWYVQPKAVYFVGIVDSVFNETDEDVFQHEIQLADTKTKNVFYDKLTFIYFEMPKFNKTENELSTRLDKWLYALKSLQKLQKCPKIFHDSVFRKLFQVAKLENLTPVEFRGYVKSRQIYYDNKNAFDAAKLKGKKEGKAECLKEIAKSLFDINLPLSQIIKVTGLSENEINEIVKQQ